MPPTLIRYFSKQEYAAAFMVQGDVRLRPLSYFRDYEDQGVRADQHEGTLVHRPDAGLQVRLEHSGELVALPHRFESTTDEDNIFVYCLSTELSADIAARFKAAIAVEVLRPLGFLAALRSALRLRARFRSAQLVHQPVRYYEWDEPPLGDWAIPERVAMRKPKPYAWQKEYRFAVPVGNAFAVENVSVRLVAPQSQRAPRAGDHAEERLRLGNLSKICKVHRF
jgi:hypothetical protein